MQRVKLHGEPILVGAKRQRKEDGVDVLGEALHT